MKTMTPLRWSRSAETFSTRALTTVFIGLWLVAMASAFWSSRTVGFGMAATLAVLGLLIVVVQGGSLGRSMAQGARVLHNAQIPQGLWRQWLQISLKESVVVWLVCAVGTTIAMQQAAGLVGPLMALAALSVAMCLAVLNALSIHGVLHPAWHWIIPSAVVGLLMSIGLLSSFNEALRWADQLPSFVLLTGVMTWPMLLLLVLNPLRRRVPVTRPESSIAMRRWVKAVVAYARRYHRLAMPSQGLMPTAAFRKSGIWSFWLLPAMFYFYISAWGHGWGANVNVMQLGVGIFGIMVLAQHLVCKDLHWRALLAPGGLHPGELGTHIATSTWGLACAGVAYAAVILVAISVAFGTPLGFVIDLVIIKLAAAPIELFFMTAAATLLRSKLSTHWQLVAVVFPILLASSGWVLHNVDNATAPLFTVGPAYLASLVLMGWAALWLANRFWTVERLMQCAPRN